jgi:protein TonB
MLLEVFMSSDMTNIEADYVENVEDTTLLRLAYRVVGSFASIVLAMAMTLTLLYLQQYLIASGNSATSETRNIQITDIVRVKEDVEVEVKKRKTIPPPLPDEQPVSIPPIDIKTNLNSTSWSLAVFDGTATGRITPAGAMLLNDGNYLPVVKVEAVYPQRALIKELAGWVLVEFTVTKTGATRDPVIVSNCAIFQKGVEVPVCRDHPNRVFDKSALAAVLKFKYMPRVISGESVATSGVRNLITFELDG